MLPAGSCDTHTHVFLDPARYPLSARRAYTPPEATTAQLGAFHNSLGIGRVVIVQPSVYEADNRATIEGIRQYGIARARGIAVIGTNTPRDEIAQMHAAGIRGVRINLETAGSADSSADPKIAQARIELVAQQIESQGWHIQTNTRLSVVAQLHDLLMKLPMPIVFDHFARTEASAGLGQPGLAELTSLLRAGKAYAKLSAPYNISKQEPRYPDITPVARALYAANPERILWGSNWPHPGTARGDISKVTPFREVDNVAYRDLLPVWFPDPADVKRIMVDNPCRLFGFEN